MKLSEKKELIVQSYSRTFDKDMAYIKVGLTQEEKELLDQDDDFQERLQIFLIEERENIIEKFKDFMDSDDEKISFKATNELAKVLYPDFFKEPPKEPQEFNVNIKSNSPEEDQRIVEEYGEILGNPNEFINCQATLEEDK